MEFIMKTISLTSEDIGLVIDTNNENDFAVVRLNTFIEDEERSKTEARVFKQNQTIEIYPDIYCLKQMVKALQQAVEYLEEADVAI